MQCIYFVKTNNARYIEKIKHKVQREDFKKENKKQCQTSSRLHMYGLVLKFVVFGCSRKDGGSIMKKLAEGANVTCYIYHEDDQVLLMQGQNNQVEDCRSFRPGVGLSDRPSLDWLSPDQFTRSIRR